MNTDLLKKEVSKYMAHREAEPANYADMSTHREEHAVEIRQWGREEMLNLDDEGLYRLISPLWAMLIWGNKQYVVDKLIAENGLGSLRTELTELVWGKSDIAARWDQFRAQIKGIGPAMMSEILCHVHPKDCAIWNRRAKAGLSYLGVPSLPKYDYQLTGQRYKELTSEMQTIATELESQGMENADLLTVDYFIWDQLQPETLSLLPEVPATGKENVVDVGAESEASEFIHNEIRDKLAEIGEWLGFKTSIETKVADGSVVDTIWQAIIGNMGTVIYVFEVQTKGSIDSAILNLLKSLNNPAVQGVVAVSDGKQLEKIKKHAADVTGSAGS